MTNKFNGVILTALLLYAFYCAISIGISWDELAHMERGNERLKYILSFGTYDYINYRDQKFYPGFYNTLVTFFTKFFPKKYEIETLHVGNFIFSISTIFAISKISKELFNKDVSKIVFILCFFNPIFFGHMAINQKDMIIAFSNIWSTYLIIKYFKKQQINEKRNYYVWLAGLTIGLGQGVRMVFFSTLFPVVLFFIFDALFLKKITNKNFLFKKLFIDIFKVFIISYLIMISCWPDTHSNIFTLPFSIFFESLNNAFGVPVGLLNGNFYNTFETPKSYLLVNLLYKMPEFILISYLLSIFIFFKNKNFFYSKFNFFNTKLILVLFIIIYPNFLILFTPYRIFDGLRLFLYIIPYICIIPSLLIYYLLINYKEKISKVLILPILSFMIYYLLIFFSLTPFHYTYINILNGKYSNAHNNFENDYWAVSLKELISKIPSKLNIKDSRKIKFAFCGVASSNLKLYFKKINNFNYSEVNFLDKDYDYIIMTNRAVVNNINELNKAKTCFQKFQGEDVVSVRRNGLILSTIRKKTK